MENKCNEINKIRREIGAVLQDIQMKYGIYIDAIRVKRDTFSNSLTMVYLDYEQKEKFVEKWSESGNQN